jgi:hypothetical protein
MSGAIQKLLTATLGWLVCYDEEPLENVQGKMKSANVDLHKILRKVAFYNLLQMYLLILNNTKFTEDI